MDILPHYEQTEPLLNLPFCTTDQNPQQCNNLHHSCCIRARRIHKESSSHLQHTALYLTAHSSESKHAHKSVVLQSVAGFCTCDVCSLSSNSSAQTFMFFCFCVRQGGKKHSGQCGGRDCSGGCKCFPEKGARVSPLLTVLHSNQSLLPTCIFIFSLPYLCRPPGGPR